ncbi:NADH-quinone oxidoreductase subunit L [Beijerinckia indica]|uniref:NADH-ubiquinone oxidoreductase chain 5 n=1 Tax=Beijerinckia indica subsp. indica (strain ATCC 9039 / DSM 1715 / NCIMB 8712) TaxID=395963 RepID=B2IHV5_BEII9|nr:NADH-quinone oxidoreductase subunit L [Beijerinckia indica]ACB95998.1 proton-translocating NADH-quinone oxidoreductase, chain L [Beijerinckia indica subsp. indica ATCC 9039]
MHAAIVFLPLAGFLIAGIFGRVIGARASEIVTTSLLFVAALLSWITFVQVGLGVAPARTELLAPWFDSGALQVDWALRIDTLTAVMLVVVTTVSALVHLYSIGYMHEDPSRSRFFAYLSFFTFTMLTLVTADNLVQMFFGWEGVGLASYLLIGFWYEKPSACAAAIKAFVANRVGDFGFLLGIFLVFLLTHSVSFDQVFAAAPSLAGKSLHVFGHDFDAMTITCLLLFMGAMGKSAQFLLHTWLPDAMEGPTPVSALIHAATMVTAGVFMVARLSPLFEQAPVALSFVTIIGATTAFFAATVGLVQNDIKRVIAYSTCSQLGYMFVALGVGGYSLGIFHLFTHAFFKALLFLGAGSVIHAMHHEQDMRKMGALRDRIPFTFWMMTLGTLALTGFPLTAGYFSKDAIIEAAFASERTGALYGYVATVVAAGLTSFYSWRLVFMTFFGPAHWGADAHAAHDDHGHAHASGHDDHGHAHALEPHEPPFVMRLPLLILGAGAVFAGLLFDHSFIGEGQEGFWKEALFYGPNNHIFHQMEEIPRLAGLAPTFMMALGFLVSLYVYILRPGTAQRWAQTNPLVYNFLLNKWYFDELYDLILIRPAFWLGRLFWKRGDQGFIDRFGPDGVSAVVIDVTRRVVKLQTGYIYHYAFAMLIGVAAIVTFYVVGGVH